MFKKNTCLFILFFLGIYGNAQKTRLAVVGINQHEQAILDSLATEVKFEQPTYAISSANKLLFALQKKGYLEATYIRIQPLTDSVYRLQFDLKKCTRLVHLNISGCEKAIINNQYPRIKDSLFIPYTKIEAFLNDSMKMLEQNGESLAQLQLRNLYKKKDYLCAQLIYTPENKRKLDTIICKGYTNFPAGPLIHLRKQYRKHPFNQNLVKQLKTELDSYTFCSQIKSPEIQFTKDSTSLYIYVQKKNANSFDGLIGFSNNETKNIKLSGYLDVILHNILNSSESIAVNWKSDGNQQTTFTGQLELPYLFASALALKAQLQITKQDSTFQNTKTALHLGYLFRFHKRMYLGYQSAESSDIQNVSTAVLSDYKNHFTTLSFEYSNPNNESLFFAEKSSFSIQNGLGRRSTPNSKTNQFFLTVKAKQDWALNFKNHVVLKNELYYLQSKTYLTNELGRFGGINSVIGFTENSLQANFYTTSRLEYRLQLSPSLYWSTVFDYGLFQDQTFSKKTTSVSGAGTGIKLATKTGLLSLLYASGSANNQAFTFTNSLIHLSLKSFF